MSVRNAVVAAAALVLSLTATVEAQRLPGGIHPEHYALTLTPDLQAATFSGDETIDVVLDHATNSITLNAAEITFDKVFASSGNMTADSPCDGSTAASAGDLATVSLDQEREQATFTFRCTMAAGKVSLHIAYTGVLNDKLRGFYLSRTKARNYAVTQFEPTDARRAYPSFDEPAMKATYDVSLVIDSGDTAISNTNLISDKPGPVAGKHTLRFATTPRMSTYLVAFLVGDFKCSEGKSDGVPIRVCSTPDKVGLTKFALESAKYVLHYYDSYFGIKYPMPKLDMVALPDFEAGAMENFGCITYRETDLLVDPKNGDIPEKKHVAQVVAHEMAHQWFGDMVTMQWWDNLWLNEGFATWMETKPVAEWHPEWGFSQDDAQSLDETLTLDAQKTTRTIRATANTPDEINEMFDGIAYGKAGAVIGMVENYLGKEVFRQGVHNYLQAHLYGNATAEDFWNAQTESSHLPVDKIMSSFVTQPGVPLLTFAEKQTASVPVAQGRFSSSSTVVDSAKQRWTIPVCIKTDGLPACLVLTPEDSSLPVPAKADMPFYANAAGKGYYRTVYTRAQFEAIAAKAETALTPPERIGLLGDRWALVGSGQSDVSGYLDLVLALKQDTSSMVLESIRRQLEKIDAEIANAEDRTKFAEVLQRQFEPVYLALGSPAKNETYDRRELRGVLFQLLGAADDPLVLNQAKELTARVFAAASKKDKTLDAALSDAAVLVSTRNGDAELYDRMLAVSKSSDDPGAQEDALHTLGRFRDPALVARTLDYMVSGQVRNQDSWTVLVTLLRNRETQDQAWNYMRKNWDKVHGQLTVSSGAEVVEATGAFCSVERREEVARFFSEHKVEAAERTLAKAIDSISDCLRVRDQQETDLRHWVELHPR